MPTPNKFDLPKLTREEAAAQNAACRLAAITAHEFGVGLAFGGRLAGDMLDITVAINGANSRVLVPLILLQRVARSYFSLSADFDVPAALQAAALEATLAPWLGRLEKAAGLQLSLRGVAPIKTDALPASRLAFTVPEMAEGGAIVVLPAPGLALPGLPDVAWTSGEEIVLRPALVLAETDITLREFEDLASGDVILMPGLSPQAALQVHLAISPANCIIAEIDGQKLIVARAGKPMSSNDAGNDGKTGAATPAAGAPVAAGSLGDVPLKVTFDLGEIELTLAEVKALVPGQAIDLARAPGTAVRLSINGRRIGTGEIVEIEGRLGVRITELTGQNEHPAS